MGYSGDGWMKVMNEMSDGCMAGKTDEGVREEGGRKDGWVGVDGWMDGEGMDG